VKTCSGAPTAEAAQQASDVRLVSDFTTGSCKLLAGTQVLLEQEYYSVGGGFIEWKGCTPPKKNPPKYPFATMKELRAHAEKNNLTIAKVILANETSIKPRISKTFRDTYNPSSKYLIHLMSVPQPTFLHSNAEEPPRFLPSFLL